MQIPMEILSFARPRADSGVELRLKTFENPRDNPLFSNVLERSAELKNLRTIKGLKGIGDIEDKPIEDARPAEPSKKDEIPEDEDLVAGVVGFQNQVVIILEGEKESATDPSISIDAGLTVDAGGEEGYVPPENNVEDTTDANAERQAAPDAANERPAADTAVDEAAITQAEITADDVKAALDAGKETDTETADPEAQADSIMGEVTARTPNVRTSEQLEKEDKRSDFSQDGDLSPLENENDSVAAKGQKDKTQSETQTGDTAKNSEGSLLETAVVNQMPISESFKPEQFAAAEKTRQTADTPVQAENLFDEMVARIEAMNSGSKQTVTIQLKPEFLGNVHLEIAMDAAGLHVKINAADSGVRGAINNQINALVESLQNKGIEVVEVEVAYTGVGDGTYKESHNNQAQPERQRRPFRMEKVVDGAAYYAALQEIGTLEYYLDAGVSSVEYSA